MRCPVCEDVQLVIASREGIEIDHCPQCRGVWLDRGELDKIIERSARHFVADSDEFMPSSREFDPRGRDPRRGESWDRPHHYDDRDVYWKKKRRKSFLEELFDFD
ncbi:MAG: hypothetical protein KatS3mg008_1354 [Acidimicrobiales bacterium]|nr:MAG: hypothetical protein KatS3mg008_1354 [Acidimicrobiales bacterium]